MTVTAAVAVALPPWPSVTVSVAVNGPAVAYACVGVAPVPVAPSPKFHANDSVSPASGSEPLPLKEIVAPGQPGIRTAGRCRRIVIRRRRCGDSDRCGRRRAAAVAVRDGQRRGERTGRRYACVGVAPVPVAPSPKVHANDSVSPASGSEPLPLKEIVAPVSPEYGPPADAVGL